MHRFDIDPKLDAAIRAAILPTPILLSAVTGAMQPGAKKGVLDTTRLTNPFDGPMFLDEIRFRISVADATTWNSYGRFNVEFKLGDINLTHSDVPVALLGRKLNPGGTTLAAQFTWRLHRPLWIPPGGFLQPIFRFDNVGYLNSGNYGDHDHTVHVTYVGRPLRKGAPIPTKRVIPWIAAYRTTPVNSVGAVSFESTEADLINPYDTPLVVSRIAGQVQGSGEDVNTAFYQEGNTPQLTHQAITLRMVDNMGRIVIRDATPFANVIKPTDDSWNVNALLPPHGFLKAMVDFTTAFAQSNDDVVVQLAMIGSREI